VIKSKRLHPGNASKALYNTYKVSGSILKVPRRWWGWSQRAVIPVSIERPSRKGMPEQVKVSQSSQVSMQKASAGAANRDQPTGQSHVPRSNLKGGSLPRTGSKRSYQAMTFTSSAPDLEEPAVPQLKPGEALKAWLEENARSQTEETPLIEELPEEQPHEPTTVQIAAEQACEIFTAKISTLSKTRESIAQATEAAIIAGMVGAAARVVRTVLDVLDDISNTGARLPCLYLLDSILKAEARSRKYSTAKDKSPGRFSRAIGAALQVVVQKLSHCDEEVRSKVERVLKIWQRDCLIGSGLIESALDSLAAEARRESELEARRMIDLYPMPSQDEMMKMWRQIPLNSVLRLDYRLSNGKSVQRLIPATVGKEDWQTPQELGLKINVQIPENRFLESSDFSASGLSRINKEASTGNNVSPWRKVAFGDDADGGIAGVKNVNLENKTDELDEFDLELLHGAVGGDGKFDKAQVKAGTSAAATFPHRQAPLGFTHPISGVQRPMLAPPIRPPLHRPRVPYILSAPPRPSWGVQQVRATGFQAPQMQQQMMMMGRNSVNFGVPPGMYMPNTHAFGYMLPGNPAGRPFMPGPNFYAGASHLQPSQPSHVGQQGHMPQKGGK
jgi:hypothetical protein